MAASVILSIAFYMRLQYEPSAYDATTYVQLGQNVLNGGLFSHWPGVDQRTYGYPLFLAVIATASNLSGLPIGLVDFAIQLIIYVAACLYLVRVVEQYIGNAAGLLLAVLLVNPVLLAYVPETLTESLTVSMFILVVALLASASSTSTLRRRTLLAATAACMTGYLVAVRPANIVLLPALFFSSVVLFGQGGFKLPVGRASRVGAAAVSLSAALPAIAIQAIVNAINFGRWTIFPVFDIGKLQTTDGTLHLKYSTNLTGLGGAPLYYDNPFHGATSARDLAFYYQEPLHGLVTMLLHDFNSLNPDFLFPYLYDLHPVYQLPLVVGAAVLVFLGFVGAVLSLRAVIRRRPNSLPIPVIVFLLAAMIGNLALNSITTVETRFGFISLMSLSIFAVIAFRRLRSASAATLAAMAGGVVVYGVVAVLLNAFVENQAVLLH